MTVKVGGMSSTGLPPSFSSYLCKRPLKVNVILRPPKDLAVLPIDEPIAIIGAAAKDMNHQTLGFQGISCAPSTTVMYRESMNR
jgi:hypothetical protein